MGTFDMAMTVAGVKILVINGQGVGMPHLVMALSTRYAPLQMATEPLGETHQARGPDGSCDVTEHDDRKGGRGRQSGRKGSR